MRIGGAKFSDEFIDQLLYVGRSAAMGGGEEDPKTSPFDKGETLEAEGVPQCTGEVPGGGGVQLLL